jgi:hypothetical protein
MNKGIGDRSPWISFLRQRDTLEKIRKHFREAGEKYRAKFGVNPKYKSAATKKIDKIERALTAVGDARLPELLKLEFGDKFKESYVKEAIDTLKKELAHLQAIVNYKQPGQVVQPELALPVPEQQQPVAMGYGLREGLGYGLRSGLGYGLREGFGYGYGYFY